jgi:hypothetical protein
MSTALLQNPEAQKRFHRRINRKPPALFESANRRRDRIRNKRAFDAERRMQKPETAPEEAPAPKQVDPQLAAKLEAYRAAEAKRREKKQEALERRKHRPRY